MTSENMVLFCGEDSCEGWTLESRVRSTHDGRKVWGLYDKVEVFSLDERGYRARHEMLYKIVPEAVKKQADKCWRKLAHTTA